MEPWASLQGTPRICVSPVMSSHRYSHMSYGLKLGLGGPRGIYWGFGGTSRNRLEVWSRLMQ